MKSRRASLRISAAIVVALGFAPLVSGAVSVIPGEMGHGLSTPAGRGGAVIRVTNLAESGTGSLKACVDASGPRVCVFEVSGTIKLSDDLTIRNRYITIAGQTAPSPGITLRGAGLLVKASDVLVQHIRVRPGDDAAGEPPINRDGLKIEAPFDAPISNVVIDHCTFTWSVDEIASAWQAWDNISLINNIFAEPLHDSIHPEGKHGFGILIGPVNGNATIAGNLLSDMQSRNPMTAATHVAVINNVVYDWGNTAVDLQSRGDITQNSVVGNVFVPGPSTAAHTDAPIGLRADSVTLLPGAKVFLSDNYAGQVVSDPWSLASPIYGTLTLANFRSNTPVSWPSGMTTLPTSENVVYERVLKYSGARPAGRDAVDTRIVDEVRKRSGGIINCVAPNGTARCNLNGGGYPNLPQNTRALTLPANPNTVTASGYTNLELWLHDMAAEVEGRSKHSPSAPVLSK